VNAEMVKAGLAWRYEEHDQQNEFGTLEDEARTNRRGLWIDAHPVPPWEWREKRAVR
jgi:endonuclease YncB( thermonuclease family)